MSILCTDNIASFHTLLMHVAAHNNWGGVRINGHLACAERRTRSVLEKRLKILRMVVNREIIQSLLLIQTARVVLIAIAIAKTGKCTLVFFIRQTCNW